jgi:hypothetical protein
VGLVERKPNIIFQGLKHGSLMTLLTTSVLGVLQMELFCSSVFIVAHEINVLVRLHYMRMEAAYSSETLVSMYKTTLITVNMGL